MTIDPAVAGTDTSAITSVLRRTQPWVRFFGILGFVLIGFMLLVGFAAGAVGVATGKADVAALVIVYPLLAIVYVFPAVYLLRYARRIRVFVRTEASHDLASALDAQRAFWKFIGIVAVVSISIALVVFVTATAAGVAAMIKAWR